MGIRISEYTKNRWNRIFKIIVISLMIGGLFSVLITYFFTEQNQIKGLLISGLFGMLMGTVVSIGVQLIQYLFTTALHRLPLLFNLIFKTLSLSLLVSLLYRLFFPMIMGSTANGEIPFFSETIIFSLALTFLINLSSTISGLLGQKVFIRLIFGTNRKPLKVNRFVMFLDLVGSTSIAEQIGDNAFLSLLNDFFADITEPVLQTEAEIYKYVGDEVILIWETQNGLKKENVLRLVRLLEQHLDKREAYYQKHYGLRPRFRAGLHFGSVIMGEMGNLKKEIAFLGDTMNTTARIQSECQKFDKNLLVSEKVKELFEADIESSFRWESHGEIALKGKQESLILYSL